MNHFIDDVFSFQALPHSKPSTSKNLAERAGHSSSYWKLLEGPVSIMAGNVPERSDANSAAILGYN
jgi:hypothetical protein